MGRWMKFLGKLWRQWDKRGLWMKGFRSERRYPILSIEN